MKFDAIVAGAGLWGCTIARRMAESGRRVLVLEKRKAVGGNCRCRTEKGIEVHLYGSHIFHTTNEEVWKFVNWFVSFNDYRHGVLANHRGKTFDYFCCLYPTAPFVNAERIRQGLEMMVAANANGAMPVVRYSYPIQRALRIAEGTLALREPEHLRSRSQDLEPMYHDAGQYYWYRTEAFKTNPNIMAINPLAIITPEEEVQDIDTIDDWKMAELKYGVLCNQSFQGVFRHCVDTKNSI